MTITVRVVADSISAAGKRITTLQLRYPRFIHAEFMTHRMFSRNASSSRAIPVAKIIADIKNDPAMPIHWGKNQPGMQAHEEVGQQEREAAEASWLKARDHAVAQVEFLTSVGIHKQVANRILEPWSHINVVVTATEWANFFALRCHPDAQPEIKQLAEMMQLAMEQHIPTLINEGDWHLPYIDMAVDYPQAVAHCKNGRVTRDEPMLPEIMEVLRKVSTARCARVSYLTHDGRRTTVAEDVALHDKLVVEKPLHASPAEHPATPDTQEWIDGIGEYWSNGELHANFVGWIQYRKQLVGENVIG